MPKAFHKGCVYGGNVEGGRMSVQKVLSILFVPVMFAACGDDDSDFVSHPDGKGASSSADVIPGSTGNLTDSRDGQAYRTVTIGTQTWMAENLNYKTANSFCYEDKANNCEKYGRLYSWAAAMDSVGEFGLNGKGCGHDTTCSPEYPLRGICPEGWHLPVQDEFEELFAAVGGDSVAARVLKSKMGWNDDGNGTDEFGFTLLSTGYRNGSGEYYFEGIGSNFWYSMEFDEFKAYAVTIYDDADRVYRENLSKYLYLAVRCIKD